MFEFRAERLPGKVFSDRATYLHDRISTEAVDRPVDSHALCNAIGRANMPFNDKRIAAAFQTSRQPKRLPANFPWLTLVLGSGCATETTDDSGLAPIAPETIKALLSKRPLLRDGMQPGDLAETFARNLISQRMPKRPKTEIASSVGLRDTRVANLVFATSLLTLLYRGLAAASQQPLDPRGNDRLELTTRAAPGAQRTSELRSIYAEAVIEFLPHMWSDQPKAVEHVLRRVDGKLKEQPGIIDRLDLQILTEFTWLALTEHCSMYYGWSSLLALVARADDSSPSPPHRSPPRPGFDRNAATGYIKEWYKKVTRQSWEQRGATHESGRIQFFDAAAKVLSAQSALRERYRHQSSVLPPVASAFSTSFDIELEMSLAKRNTGFVMVLPVHYLHEQRDPSSTERTKRASLHWLGAVIPPADASKNDKAIELDQILRPNTWFMLSGARWYDTWPHANWPFIVHLAGCPVIQLPEIGAPIHSAGPDAEPQPMRDMPGVEAILPAVLLDEYGAIQQHSTEMFGGLPSGASYGLPDQLTSPSEDSARARFWMLMGVQMGDAAIRYGIASRLGTGRRGLDTLKLPDRAGLVVSSNVDPAARDLMQWYGVDLVQQDCGAFTEDLEHYSEHLQVEHADQWPSYFDPGDQCPLLSAKREIR